MNNKIDYGQATIDALKRATSGEAKPNMKEQLKKIGTVGTIKVSGLTVSVKILDYKKSYGHDRWLVTPVKGEGSVWAEDVVF